MRRRLLIGVIALWALGLGGAGATVVEALSLDALDALADRVVHGRVVAVRVAWRRGVIESVATIEVETTLAGEPVDRVEVRWLGGRVGAIEQRVPGGVRLAVGQEAVLFLRRVGAGHAVVGQRQGVMLIGEVSDDAVTDLRGSP